MLKWWFFQTISLYDFSAFVKDNMVTTAWYYWRIGCSDSVLYDSWSYLETAKKGDTASNIGQTIPRFISTHSMTSCAASKTLLQQRVSARPIWWQIFILTSAITSLSAGPRMLPLRVLIYPTTSTTPLTSVCFYVLALWCMAPACKLCLSLFICFPWWLIWKSSKF
jgi:hypothetical protein